MEQKYIIIIVVVIVLVLCCCSSLIVGITTGIIYGTGSSNNSEKTGDTNQNNNANGTQPTPPPEDTSPEVKVPLEAVDVSLSSLLAGYPVGKLIDGNADTFSHTNDGNKEWIKITLKKEIPITKVLITNRKDCCRDRIVGATLTITNASGSTTFTEKIVDNKPVYTITPTKGTIGKVILLQRPDSGKPLNIAEMEVYTRQSQLATYPPQENWRCVAGFDVPVTKNTAGDVQCMSANGHDCVSGGCAANILNPPSPVKPLVCGEMHQKEWGGPGYNDPNHWCAKMKPLI